MGCFDDEDRELDEAAKPYLEPLIDALESNWNTVSSNGICTTRCIEWEGPKVLMMSVLVVPDQGVYEFECIGPDGPRREPSRSATRSLSHGSWKPPRTFPR